MIRQISAVELAEWLADPARPQPFLLDVREPWEHEHCAINGSVLIPMATIPARLAEVPEDAEVVCICHHGARSMQVAMFLDNRNVGRPLNLTGGIDAWSLTVDPQLARY